MIEGPIKRTTRKIGNALWVSIPKYITDRHSIVAGEEITFNLIIEEKPPKASWKQGINALEETLKSPKAGEK